MMWHGVRVRKLCDQLCYKRKNVRKGGALTILAVSNHLGLGRESFISSLRSISSGILGVYLLLYLLFTFLINGTISFSLLIWVPDTYSLYGRS